MALTSNQLNSLKEYIDKNYRPKAKKVIIKIESYKVCKDCYTSQKAIKKRKNTIEKRSSPEDFKISERLQLIDEETWQEALLKIIDERQLSDSSVYNACNVSRQVFYKIRCDRYYKPTRNTAIRLCFGLRLTLDEALKLLSKAGYYLSESNKRDVVIRWFLEDEIYDVYELDEILYDNKYELIMNY